MYDHWHHAHRCGRGASRLFWFVFGAGAATWWHYHKEHHAWLNARHCGRDRIPQHAYPAPGAVPPPPSPGSPPPGFPHDSQGPTPGTVDKWDRWGWGPWGKGSCPGQENTTNGSANGNWDRWGWANRGQNANPRPEGAWGPPMPNDKSPEKDVVQQATDTITEMSEATLNNLLVTVQSLKAKLAEHREQREQQERELQALRDAREAKFKQFEEWQRQQEQLFKQDQENKDQPPRRLV